MTLGHVSALLLGAAVASGCASSEIASYADARDDWTRSVDHFDGVEARLTLYATLKTAPFVAEYVKEYARIFALTETERTRLLEAEQAELEDEYVVWVALTTMQRSWRELDPQRGIWAVRLEGADESKVARPTSVKRLRRTNPTWRHLFPYFHDEYQLYEVRFARKLAGGQPLAASGEQLALVVAGAPAQVRLSWQLP